LIIFLRLIKTTTSSNRFLPGSELTKEKREENKIVKKTK